VATTAPLQPEALQQAPTQATQPIEAVSEAEAREWIFMKESTNRLDAVNSIGCKGLGQDCNGQLEIDCPDWQTNRDCQTAFFDRYVSGRYGNWTGAIAFWRQNNWY